MIYFFGGRALGLEIWKVYVCGLNPPRTALTLVADDRDCRMSLRYRGPARHNLSQIIMKLLRPSYMVGMDAYEARGTFGDLILGGTFGDLIPGGTFGDLIQGGTFGDLIQGGTFGDFIQGGTFEDLIQGGTFEDLILGGTFGDLILGGTFGDLIQGGTFEDLIQG
ncbi:hypothetical protein RRG08_044176 [Elysia crispata]|uniref:Calcium-binding protein n=1 Tax=Elysia crispata TaxID=231223 RepID=A0AAE0XWI8_9GAST|nr:hypothetical protein RRG08_044176 [Elysia crispata]